MASFSEDEKWLEAKKIVGANNSWIDIISVYRYLGGKNVFVYIIGDKDKRQIVDIVDDENNVLLISKYGEPIIEDYDTVEKSRKSFNYSEDIEERTYYIAGKEASVIEESQR